ncbi:MAG: hypothetical protein Q7K43_04790 [Candidatus Woesearchaeota archaeon]|nr:hypothetical protein [Candidatus Woesearchaeota archaeon]
MFESIAILVIFFFLIAFGATIWYGAQKTSLTKDLEQTLANNALNIALRATHSPELDCSLLGVQQQECIDITKAEQFQTIILQEDARITYFELFGFSTITLTQIYPKTAQESLILYTNLLKNATSTHTTNLPILIQNPTQRTTSFGVLKVQTYAKT